VDLSKLRILAIDFMLLSKTSFMKQIEQVMTDSKTSNIFVFLKLTCEITYVKYSE